MRKLDKAPWVFEITVNNVTANDEAAIEKIIRECDSVIIGNKRVAKILSFLIVTDLVALDTIMTIMAELYPCRVRYRKAKTISFK